MQDQELPIRGLSDLLGPDRQERGTTRRAKNVTDLAPEDDSIGISQRAGQSKHTSAAIVAATKVAHMAQIVYDNPSHTYANLASANCTVEADSEAENRSNAYAGARDDLGNYFYVDGAAGLVKLNPSLRKVWRVALPALEPNSVVRAVAVDAAGRIFAGVSAGVRPDQARIFAYQEVEDGEPPELLWTLEPGWLTEEMHVDGATLQASQNDTLRLRSRMALYSGLGLATPTLIREWEIPYPVNGHHFSPKDGSIFTAHGPNENRTLTSGAPETTGSREDWTPRDLDYFNLRAWSWTDADDLDGGGLGNVDYDDGDVVDVIVDKTGNGRGWVTHTGDTGPQLIKDRLAGRDTLYFNGTSNSMASAAPVSTDFQFRALNRSVLPCYTKAQFVVFMVVRLPQEATQRVLLAQSDAAGENRVLLQNSMTRSVGFQGASGCVTCSENAIVSGASGPTYGGNVSPLPGGFDASGLVMLTWIHDGGYDDVASVPTRSTFRVNGRPCDRWTSDDIFASLNATHLFRAINGSVDFTGMARGRGDFCEMLVLSDWYLPGFAETSGQVQQRLITTPIYPDAVWAADGDTELERIEGYLAHKWGLAHKLPTGNAAVLEATNNPSNGQTVTIGSRTYTWRSALTPLADEVLIGASGLATLQNLHHAINLTGQPGTQYAAATTANDEVWSPGVLANSNSTPDAAILIQRRDPRISGTFATTETSSNQSFLNGTTSVTSLNGSGENVGIYPHSFHLFRTTVSDGGPPRSAGVNFPSVVGALISPYGMLAKWDPANGRCRNVLTTDGPGAGLSGLPVGGVGYGVRIASDGSVFSIGPRQAAISALGISADPVDVRKVWDKGAEDTTGGGWVLTLGATAITAWEANPGEQTYAYPRMDVDEWDNVYVPIYQSSAGTSLAVYAKLGTGGGSFNADPLLILQSLTDDPKAHAALIDSASPLYPSGYSKPRAEKVLLLTERPSTSNFDVLYLVRIVSATPSNVSPRATKRLAVVGAGIYDFSNPASVTTVDANAFAAVPRFVDGCEAFGKLFWTDGNRYREYDPRTGTLSFYRSRTAGEIPLRGRYMARFVNRVFIGGFEDAPERLCASEAGDPYGWNFDPPGEAPLTTAAYRSDLTATGDFPDLLTGLAAWKDDYLYALAGQNVFLIRGDPLQGGKFDQVTKGVGAAAGRAWCFTPDGRFWWITDQAELWVAVVGSSGVDAKVASARIAKRLRDAIDFSACRPELQYDPRTREVRIWLFPTGVGNTLFRHFRLRLDSGAFWEDSYGTTDVQPTSALMVSADAPADRVLLLGSRDGYVREWDPAAPGDDGVRIDSEVLIAPLHDPALGVEALASGFEVLLSRSQGGARIELYATDEPDDLGDPVDSASLLPGRNTPRVRASGAYLGALIAGETGVERWTLRRIAASVEAAGMIRARGR